MKAVILAAGVASRLRPLTNTTPKCLLKVGNKSILEKTVDNLIANNIKEIIVVTGYLQEMIKGFLVNNYPQLTFNFIFNERFDSTNNIYSLWMTKEKILSNEMLLLDSDIVFDSRIIKQLINSKYENCLAMRSDHELGDEEIKLLLNENGSIKEISKIVDPKFAGGESIGIEKFSKEFVKKLFAILDKKILQDGRINVFYEEAFQDIINEGELIYPIDVENYKCMEIDTASDLKSAALIINDIL